MLRLRPFSLAAALVALLAVRAQAQEPTPTPDTNPVKMTLDSPMAYTSKPFAVSTRFGRWFPLSVTLSNSGDAVTGTLRLSLVTSSNGYGAPDKPVSEFSTVVDLPANQANKRVWLYGRVEREECDAAVVEYSGPGIRARRVRFDLSAMEPTTRCVVTISDKDERLSFLSAIRDAQLGLPDANDTQINGNRFQPNPTHVRTGGAVHQLLPTRWIGFDAADAVVLHDFPHTSLSPAQLDALRGYVAGGGTLVALGGANWQRLASSPLKDLWPMQPASSVVAPRGTDAALVARYVTRTTLRGEDKLGGAPILVSRGTLNPQARVYDETVDAPLLTARDFGAGRVVMLSYDPTLPPFSGWSGQQELWKDIFGLSPRPARVQGVVGGFDQTSQPGYYTYGNEEAAQAPTTTLLGDLSRTPQLKTPPVSNIAWFLALYVFFLVPLNYIVLRVIDKREWAWVTVPVIVAAFSTLAYATALRIKGRDLLSRRVEIVRASNAAPMARADALLWLFSPRKTAYTLTGSDARLVVAPRVGPSDVAGTGTSSVQPDETKPITVGGAAVNMWDNRAFVASSTLDLKNGIGISRAGKDISVRNGSGYDLRGAVLVSGGQVFALGPIPSGKSKITGRSDGMNSSSPQLLGRVSNASKIHEIFPSNGSEDPASAARSALLLALGRDFGSRPVEGSLLIAWGNEPVTTLRIDQEESRDRNVSLFLVRAPDVSTNATRVGEASVSAPSVQDNARGGRAGAPTFFFDARFSPGALPTGTLQLGVKGLRHGYYNGTYYNDSNTGRAKPPALSLWNWRERAWERAASSSFSARAGNASYNSYAASSWSMKAALSSARAYVRSPDGLVRARVDASDVSMRDLTLRVRAE